MKSSEKTKENDPLVSIAMATYNGEAFLAEQINSLLNQTYKNIEIIISDDNSTDQTIPIIKEFVKKDKRLFFSVNPNPNGFKKNFERAISLCRGEIIFLCDQDDIWHDKKVQRHLEIYDDKKVKWVFNEVNLVNDIGDEIKPSGKLSNDYYTNISLFHMIGGRCILGCATSYRAEMLKKMLPIEDSAPGHDSFMQMAIYPANSFHIKEILQDYRQHDKSVTNKLQAKKTDIDENIKKSIFYTKELIFNNRLSLWKRLYLLIILTGKITKCNIRNMFKFISKNKLGRIRFNLYYFIFFRIKVWIQRKITRLFNVSRPASFPFITGDGFRSFAQHVFDDISDIDTENVCIGDIIFVRSDMLHDFFKKVLPKIKNRFILLSNNADNNISIEYKAYKKNMVMHWYAQNLLYEETNVTPLPIGIANLRYHKEINLINKARSSMNTKKNKILLAFRPNPERIEIRKKLSGIKTTDDVGNVDKKTYYERIAEYKFIASPEGNGIDCHRTWESMYLKSVPIVIKNVMTEYFEKIGLPIMTIDKWEDLIKIDESFLDKKYDEMKRRFDSPALYIDYWQKLISKNKNDYQ